MPAPLPPLNLSAVAIALPLAAGLAPLPARAIASSRSVQEAAESRRLAPGEHFELAIAAGESHNYEITAATGKYLHLDVGQNGIDVAVTLAGPSGQTLSEIRGTGGAEKGESISIIGDPAGVYRFAVHVPEGTEPSPCGKTTGGPRRSIGRRSWCKGIGGSGHERRAVLVHH